MAIFRKRGKLWEFRIRYYDPATGKRTEYARGGFTTQAEAKMIAKEEERKLDRGADLNKQDMTLKEFLEFWFEHYKVPTVSHNRKKNIDNAIQLFVKHLGNTSLRQLNRTSIQAVVNKVSPDYTKSSIQSYTGTIREAFECAIDLDYMFKNPAKKIIYPKSLKPVRNPVKHIELDEYLKLVEAIEKEWSDQYLHYKYITFISIGTGARVGEICALNISDIDEINKTLNINKTFIREDNVWKVKPTTKTGESGERVIGLDDYTFAKIKEWLKFRKKIADRSKCKNNFLFINEIGEFVKTVNYGSNLRKICLRNGLRHKTPHMFRHTHETIMWESGISDINYIGDRLGDKDKSILLNTYGHKSRYSDQINNEKINQIMARWTGEQ